MTPEELQRRINDDDSFDNWIAMGWEGREDAEAEIIRQHWDELREAATNDWIDHITELYTEEQEALAEKESEDEENAS